MEFEARNSTEAALHEYKAGLGVFTQKMPEFAGTLMHLRKSVLKKGFITEGKAINCFRN